MFIRVGLGIFALALLSTPALADSCASEPVAPAAIDGSKATEQQVKDAIKDFKTFQTASDTYQTCLLQNLNAQKAEAAKKKPPVALDPSIEQGIQAKLHSNQSTKDTAGAELNAAINAYNAAHPKG